MVPLDARTIFFGSEFEGAQTAWREFLGYFVKQFWPAVNTQIDKLSIARLDYPLLVFPLFLVALITLFDFWREPTWRRSILAGFSVGLVGYAYFHAWVYLIMVIVLLLLYTFFFQHYERARMRGILLVVGATALTAIPYVINFVRFQMSPGHEDFTRRVSMADGREFALAGLGFDYLLYTVLAVAACALWFKRDRIRAVFFLAIIGALASVRNIQLITGFVPAPDHWSKIASPVLYIVGSIIAVECIRFLKARYAVIGFASIALATLLAFSVVIKKAINVVSIARAPQMWVRDKYFFPKDIADSWDWIHENIPGEPRVISSSFLTSQYLAVYTSARPFLPQAIISPLPSEELERRYLIASKRFGVSEATLDLQLRSRTPEQPCLGDAEGACYYRGENFGKLTDDLYACFFSRGGVNTYFRQGCGLVPDKGRSEILDRYRTLRPPQWQDIEAEYVYYGPWERQFSNPDFKRDPELQLIFQNSLVEIYRVVRPIL